MQPPPQRSRQEDEPRPQLGLFAEAPQEMPDAKPGASAAGMQVIVPNSESDAEVSPRELEPEISLPPARSRRPLRSNRGSTSLPSWAYASIKPASPVKPAAGPELATASPDLADFFDDVPDPAADRRRIWTVAGLVSQVRAHIEQTWADLWVHGEISNLRTAPSGHLYFTLKDGESQLPAVLFRRQAQLLRFQPEDGLEVLLRGKVSVYEQRGQMQLIAEHLEPVGAGSLQIAFEQLKARLAAEGLFEASRKRALPAYPRCVGIVTSPAGAVIRDFLNVAGRRHAALDVLLYPAAVQGGSAAAEIAAGIAYFNAARNVDVIVIARGGGSLEDLAPFNTEVLARAIAQSALPVVSAIGHETDFTIADFVADLRAPTPSAAAELITAAQHRVEEQVAALEQRLIRACRYQIILARQRFGALPMETTHARLTESFNRREQRVDALCFRLQNAHAQRLRATRERLQAASSALQRHDARQRLQLVRSQWLALDARLARVADPLVCRLANRYESLDDRLRRAALDLLRETKNAYGSLARQLENLSPLTVLSRGYALVFNAEGELIKRAADVNQGEVLTLQLAEGSLRSRVENRLEDAGG